MDVCVTRFQKKGVSCGKPEHWKRADKSRSKSHIIARSGPGLPSFLLWQNYLSSDIQDLPFDERTVDPEETRDGLFAAIELLCKVAINFSIR